MKNRASNMPIYLYGVLLIIGLTLSYFGIKQYLITSKILSIGIITDAELIEFITVYDSDGNTYKPVFKYSDNSGAKAKYTDEVSYAEPIYEIGDKAKIVYNPNNKNEIKMLSFWGLYRWPVIFLSLAPPFLLIGGGYLLYLFRY